MSKFLKPFGIDAGWIILLIILVANICLVFLPLTNSLGYEFSAVNSIILFLIGGFYFIKLAKKVNLIEYDFNKLLSSKRAFFISFPTVAFIIGFISTVAVSKCPFVNGTLFYFVVTLPGYFSGIVLGAFSIFLTKRFSYLLFLFIFSIIALTSLFEIYFYPGIYFYNLIIGYFPGTIYDEDLRVDNMLLAYRLFNISFLIIVLYVHTKFFSANNTKRITTALILVAMCSVFYLSSSYIKLSTNKTRLENTLYNSVTTQNFIIHLPDSTTREEKIYAGLLHEYYFEKNNLLIGEPYNSKIDSYIFYDKIQKRELIGAGNANIAKPWLNQIFLNNSSYEQTLKHELVHVLASKYGTTPFKIADKLNSAMLEGFAMAIENNYDDYPVHHAAKLAYQAGYKVNISSLFSGMNFFLQPSSVSYVYAGSFVKYLIDKYGIDKVRLLYHELDFEKQIGSSLDKLSEDYSRFIQSYQIVFNKNAAQYYFGGQTIFKKFCPRVAASDNKKAAELYRQERYDNALKSYQKVFDYSNLVNALVGATQCFNKQKKYDAAVKYLSAGLNRFNKSQYYYSLELFLADNLLESGKIKEALAVYDTLLVQNPHVDYTNSVSLRKELLREGIDSLKKYLDGPNKTKFGMLLNLNSKGLKNYSVSFLISMANKEHFDLSDYFKKMKATESGDETYIADSFLDISKYFLRKLDFYNAKIFAEKSVNKNSMIDKNHRFVENLRMVNWFAKYGTEKAKTFRYANGL